MSPSRYTGLLLLAIGAAAVLGVGGWLRFAGLGDRPVHFDEATNARLLGTLLETGESKFDREHFHGPLLNLATGLVVRMRGESAWQDLTKHNLRLSVALLSFLTVAGGLVMGRFGRRWDGVAAAAFVATSPLLAYYGRMYIHEPMFVAFGLMTLLCALALIHRPGVLAAIGIGLGAGLMACTRETFVISLFAWGMAACAWPPASGESWWGRTRRVGKTYGFPLLLALGIGLGLIIVVYSDFGRSPRGVLDFAGTYFHYSLVPGHEKPFFYYAHQLLWPKSLIGVWWTEIGVLAFALVGYVRCQSGRFLVHSGLIHLLVFSLIGYKTPWLSSLGWLHLCLAAGLGAIALVRESRGAWRVAAVAAVVVVLAWQTTQSRRAVFRFASDARNPYAYVPTSPDVEGMSSWLDELANEVPEIREDVVTVVGAAYWPLPWYLREFDQVGYWKELPAGADTRALILLVSSAAAPDTSAIDETHVFFPRGLRHEVLVTVGLRKDLWEASDP